MGGNVFEPGSPRHAAFAKATATAEMELLQLNSEDLAEAERLSVEDIDSGRSHTAGLDRGPDSEEV
jgi:hypothetical protein